MAHGLFKLPYLLSIFGAENIDSNSDQKKNEAYQGHHSNSSSGCMAAFGHSTAFMVFTTAATAVNPNVSRVTIFTGVSVIGTVGESGFSSMAANIVHVYWSGEGVNGCCS